MMGMDLYQAENALRGVAERKGAFFWSRMAYLLVNSLFLRFGLQAENGDVLILLVIQFSLFSVLVLPGSQIRSRAFRLAFMIADFLFLIAGLIFVPHRSIALLLIFSLYFLNSFYTYNLSRVAGNILLFLVILLGGHFQIWIPMVRLLPDAYRPALWLLALVAVAMPVYLMLLGLPVHSHLSTLERMKKSIQLKRMALQSMGRLCACRFIRELLQECRQFILDALPSNHLELIMVTGERAFVLEPESANPGQEFSLQQNTYLRQCLTSEDPVVFQYRQGPKRHAATQASAPASPMVTEFYFCLHHDQEAGRAYCARLVRENSDLSEEEKELIQSFCQLTDSIIGITLNQAGLQKERKESAARLQILQREQGEYQITAQLFLRLNQVRTADEALDTIQAGLHASLQPETSLLLRRQENTGRIELIGRRTTGRFQLKPGYCFEPNRSALDGFLKQRDIVLKSSNRTETAAAPPADDLMELQKQGLASLFIIPLVDHASTIPFGAMILGHSDAGHFKIDQLGLLEKIQPALAAAIRRSWDMNETGARNREAEAIQILFELLAKYSGPEELAAEAGALLQPVLDLDRCRFQLVASLDTITATTPSEIGGAEPAAAPGSLEDLVQASRQPQIIANTHADSRFADFERPAGSRIMVPVMWEEHYFGVIDAWKQNENSLDETEAAVLTRLASLTGCHLAARTLAKTLEKNAITDSLSNLFNYAYFYEQVKQEAAQNPAALKPFTLILAQIPDLNQINLQHGRPAGDAAIRTVALVLREAAREQDIAARIGGGSFGLLLRGMAAPEAVLLVHRLLERLASQQTAAGTVSLWIGAASFPLHGNTLPSLFKQAKDSLALAMKKGNSGFAFPEIELRMVQGELREINLSRLYQEILGPNGKCGPHTPPLINQLIQQLIQWGYDEQELTDLLSRLLGKLDYPNGAWEYTGFVTALCARLGKEVKLPDAKLRHLQIAARIYDIGKFAVRPDILFAPRVLSQPERLEVMNHVKAGVQDILKFHKIFAPVIPIIKFHHERWDGSGYPWHLKGEEIPLESQVLGISDVLRAMLTDRPYRPRMPLPEAIAQLRTQQGTLFDARLVELTASLALERSGL